MRPEIRALIGMAGRDRRCRRLSRVLLPRCPAWRWSTRCEVRPPALHAMILGLVGLACVGLQLLRLPSDLAREHHAIAARLGLVDRSMLAARDFELSLAAMEQWVLGPLARRL